MILLRECKIKYKSLRVENKFKSSFKPIRFSARCSSVKAILQRMTVLCIVDDSFVRKWEASSTLTRPFDFLTEEKKVSNT